jgi:hypothetical protein
MATLEKLALNLDINQIDEVIGGLMVTTVCKPDTTDPTTKTCHCELSF